MVVLPWRGRGQGRVRAGSAPEQPQKEADGVELERRRRPLDCGLISVKDKGLFENYPSA